MGILAAALSALGLSASNRAVDLAPQLAAQSLSSPAEPRRRPQGGAGTLVTAGTVEAIDQNPEVRGKNWVGEPGRIGIGAKMMADPHVRQSTEYVIAPLIAGTWRHRPASDSPIDREIAAFCDHAWFDCLPWSRVVRSIVRGYVRDGTYLAELTDDFRPISRDRFPHHPGNGVAILPTGLHERPAWSITRYNQSPTHPEQLSSVRQFIRGGDTETAGYRDISADRLLRFTWDQDGASFTGIPILRSAYQPWKLKMLLLTLEGIKHERTSVGTPVLELNDNADDEDVAVAETTLAELRVNEKGYIVLPHGAKLNWLMSQSSSDIDSAIARCNIDIAMNVAAGFMLLSLQSGTGSNALGGTQQGQHHLGIVGHAAFVSSIFNLGADGWSPIERIVRLNYGPDVAVPRLEVRHLPTRNWLDVVDACFRGVQSGVLTADDETEDEVRQILQLNPRDPSTARRGDSANSQPTKHTDEPADQPAEEQPIEEQAAEPIDEQPEVEVASAKIDALAVDPRTALNGAQVAELRRVILDVATRQLPRQTGVETMAAAFPITLSDADRIMGEVGRSFFVDTPAPPATEPHTSPEPDDEQEEVDDEA